MVLNFLKRQSKKKYLIVIGIPKSVYLYFYIDLME